MSPSMQAAINRNRKRQALFRRADHVAHHVALRWFAYEDAGLAWKAERMLANCQRILKPRNDAFRNKKRSI